VAGPARSRSFTLNLGAKIKSLPKEAPFPEE
jgi:hypothetical protein